MPTPPQHDEVTLVGLDHRTLPSFRNVAVRRLGLWRASSCSARVTVWPVTMWTSSSAILLARVPGNPVLLILTRANAAHSLGVLRAMVALTWKFSPDRAKGQEWDRVTAA